MKRPNHLPLEDLVPRYGGSTHTGPSSPSNICHLADIGPVIAWTDPGYNVWHRDETGAAIGYIDSHSWCNQSTLIFYYLTTIHVGGGCTFLTQPDKSDPTDSSVSTVQIR
jgi:hypothetical protein